MIVIALVASELPVHLLSEITDRLHDRAGCLEARFDWYHDPALLPVKWDGSVRLLRWGCRGRRSPLPVGSCSRRHRSRRVWCRAWMMP